MNFKEPEWVPFVEWVRLREWVEVQMPAASVDDEAAFLRFMAKLLEPLD